MEASLILFGSELSQTQTLTAMIIIKVIEALVCIAAVNHRRESEDQLGRLSGEGGLHTPAHFHVCVYR